MQSAGAVVAGQHNWGGSSSGCQSARHDQSEQPLTAMGGDGIVAGMRKRVDRHGMVGPYGVRYSWVYWAVTAATFALLIVDIFDDGAIWNYGVVVCIIIAIAVRPGGVRGPRVAAAADEPGPRAT
jgi:hypothetical protein